MKPADLVVVYELIDTLEAYANNARTHSDAQLAQIAASIEEFGFTNPILVWRNGILAGHGRVLAARLAGLDSVPVIRLDHLTKAQARAYVLADNKLALNSGWDLDLLKSELEALRDEEFDLDTLGWDDAELAGLFPDEEGGEPGEKEEHPEEKTPKLSFGDYRIDITPGELEALTEAVQAYDRKNGSLVGFAAALVRGW